MKKSILFFLIIYFLGIDLTAQNNLPNNPSNLPSNLSSLIKSESREGWIFLKDSLYVHPDSLFTKYKSFFELGIHDSVVCIETSQDSYSGIHKTYILFHRGIEVYPFQIKVHDYSGKGLIINGNFPKGINVTVSNLISPNNALSKVLKQFSNSLLMKTSDSISILNTAKLCITSKDYALGGQLPYYRFEVYTDSPELASYEIYIDAFDGMNSFKYKTSANVTANACTKFYGQQNVNVLHYSKVGHFGCYPYTFMSSNSYYCLDTIHDFKFWSISPKNAIGNTISNSLSLTNFSCDSLDEDKFANQNYWIVKSHLEMIKNKFNYTYKRDFTNGFECNVNHPNYSGHPFSDTTNYMDIIVSAFIPIRNNAIYLSNKYILTGVKFSNTDSTQNNYPYTYVSSMDVVGHELGHLLIEQTAKLKLIKEPGALNEGIADIFGFMTERYLNSNYNTGKTTNWKIGEDFNGVEAININNGNLNGYLRDLQNPEIKNNPSIYEGNYWIDTRCCNPKIENDFCGIHVNSTVLTKWFQLLNDGGSFNGKNITAYGNSQLEQLIFYTLKNFMTPTSAYRDVRFASLVASEILFGQSSIFNVKNAWDAVGVKDLTPLDTFSVTISAGNTQWTGEKYLFDNLIIDSGAILKLDNCKLYMKEGRRIIVKKEGTLKLRQSIITIDQKYECDINKFWQGIKVEPISEVLFNVSERYNANGKGSLIMDSSKIEFANIAIASGLQNIEDGHFIKPLNYIYQSGGNLRIENSTFSNNVTDVHFLLDRFGSGGLWLNKSIFRTDEEFSLKKKKFIFVSGCYDIDEYLSNPNSQPWINGEIYSSCLIEKCIFKDAPLAKGIEIQPGFQPWATRDSLNFIIKNNTFSNIGHSIYLNGADKVLLYNDTFINNKAGLSVSYAGNIKIHNCFFNNNDTSIYLGNNLGHHVAEVYNNTIRNTGPLGASIYITNFNNAYVHDNTFYEVSKLWPTNDARRFSSAQIIASKNTELKDNFFYKSNCINNNCVISQFTSAVTFNFNSTFPNYFLRNSISDSNWIFGLNILNYNRGLKIKCNAFGGNIAYSNFGIIYGAAIYLEGAIPNQGKGCNSHYEPSGNRFLWNATSFPNSHRLYREWNFLSNVNNDTFVYYNHGIYQTSADQSPNSSLKYINPNNSIYNNVCTGNGYTMYNNSCTDDNLKNFLPAIITNNTNSNPCEDNDVKAKLLENWQILNNYKDWIFAVNRSKTALQPFIDIYFEILQINNFLQIKYGGCYDRASIKQILVNSEIIDHQIQYAELLQSEGDWNGAKNVVDNLSNLQWEKKLFNDAPSVNNYDIEIAQYQTVFNILYQLSQTNQPISSLNSTTLNILENIRTSEYSSSVKAEEVLSFYYKRRYLKPSYQASDSSNSSQDNNAVQNYILALSPNPANNEVNITLNINTTYTSGELKILSLLNPQSVIFTDTFSNTDLYEENVDISNAPYGPYIVVVYIDGVWKISKLLLKSN